MNLEMAYCYVCFSILLGIFTLFFPTFYSLSLDALYFFMYSQLFSLFSLVVLDTLQSFFFGVCFSSTFLMIAVFYSLDLHCLQLIVASSLAPKRELFLRSLVGRCCTRRYSTAQTARSSRQPIANKHFITGHTALVEKSEKPFTNLEEFF